MSDFKKEKDFKQKTSTVTNTLAEFLGISEDGARKLYDKLGEGESNPDVKEDDR